jgi:hypothetical protein
MSRVICPYRMQQMLVKVQVNDLIVQVREPDILHAKDHKDQAFQHAAMAMLMTLITDADSAVAPGPLKPTKWLEKITWTVYPSYLFFLAERGHAAASIRSSSKHLGAAMPGNAIAAAALPEQEGDRDSCFSSLNLWSEVV